MSSDNKSINFRIEFGGKPLACDHKLAKRVDRRSRKDLLWFLDRPHRSFRIRNVTNTDIKAFKSIGLDMLTKRNAAKAFVIVGRLIAQGRETLSYVWGGDVSERGRKILALNYAFCDDLEDTIKSSIADSHLIKQFTSLMLQHRPNANYAILIENISTAEQVGDQDNG